MKEIQYEEEKKMYSFKPKILDFKRVKKQEKIENTESKYTINEEYRNSEILSNQSI